MIYKRCGRCGKRIPSGTTCGCYQKIKREYKPADGIKKEYHRQRWKDMRAVVLQKYHGIDLYMLYRYGRIVVADTVHHIHPTSKHPELFYRIDNLIPVSGQAHREIHERYKREDALAVIKELEGYIQKFENGGAIEKV